MRRALPHCFSGQRSTCGLQRQIGTVISRAQHERKERNAHTIQGNKGTGAAAGENGSLVAFQATQADKQGEFKRNSGQRWSLAWVLQYKMHRVEKDLVSKRGERWSRVLPGHSCFRSPRGRERLSAHTLQQ